MQKFDFTAPATGAPQVVNVPGRYLKYVTGNAGGNDAGLIITPGSKPGSKILLYPGQAITLPDDGTAGPNGWTLANALGQAVITGTVVVGNGKIDDNTLSGTVQVVDGGKSRTLAGVAFVMYGQQLAMAAQYSRVQLWNPAASGKRLIVESMDMTTAGAAASAFLTFNTTQLATLVGAGVAKRSSAAVGTGLICTDTTATQPAAGGDMFSLSLAAASYGPQKFTEPLCIDPGYGLVLWGAGQNVQFGCTFEWFEEPNV